jgi:hypothetical protein
MAKRRDNDSTMDISASQLVPENRPPVPKQPGVNKNDVSMWIGGVVGADDFAGARSKPKKSRAPLLIGGLLVFAAAAGGAYYMFGSTSSSPTEPVADSPSATTPSESGSAGSSEVPAEAPAAAVAPADAAVELALPDAAVEAPAMLAADAVSGADPKHKVTKKKVTKKKKTVAKKKKRRK